MTLLAASKTYFPFGFPRASAARERYNTDAFTRPDEGAANPVYAIRALAQRMNAIDAPWTHSGDPVRAGDLLAFDVLQSALRHLIDTYCRVQRPGILQQGMDWVRAARDPHAVDHSPPAFVALYPPRDIDLDEDGVSLYLASYGEGQPNLHIAATELILLHLAMANRAAKPLRGLFDDSELSASAPYMEFVSGLEDFFGVQPPLQLLDRPLFECLRAPLLAAPDSLEAQLAYVREHWAAVLPEALKERLDLVRGVLEEDARMRGGGPGPTDVMRFGVEDSDPAYPEPERFSTDADWMSHVVLVAKIAYVWLDQLSKKYGRWIQRLNEIPDEELDLLASWGFNGLWLIGVWERSPASERIKRDTGNPEAAASAYSLYDYTIAADLGGEPALRELQYRAGQRGIRLASDMVPNHVGIYSRWTIEHPDWFIQSDHAPFPSYSFDGQDLSCDERVGIYIEDGYWDQRDAAVVFKRTDRSTGDTRYIYHGNDGTHMPWNDTAQLNYLLPEVREAVIQTILHVARMFPIIRFDAAMTLAKKHFQRLWFPKPGDAGAIPSRAEHGMDRSAFDAHIPEEFWREVVDRIAAEVPDTLLLAEAFWLMEGYFVRTLGMHRVYNSAFMNMVKMEENAKYRETIKNVLEFSPRVLMRFVNFMNNPDERTAVEQFGKGDKYFGVTVMMATMPGLPMFGHGQIEALEEKYGMEYRRAYRDEHADEEVVRRHELEIFPLLRRRYLFSGAHEFALYDFVVAPGAVDENVYAYSNRAGDERAIVLYNNAYNTTEGRIRESTGINMGSQDETHIVRRTLADALAINAGDRHYYIFREHRARLEYIRSGKELTDSGLFVQLHAYQYNVFLDFREVVDEDGTWSALADRLGGGGVPNMSTAYKALAFAEQIEAFAQVMSADALAGLTQANPTPAERRKARANFRTPMLAFLQSMRRKTALPIDDRKCVNELLKKIDAIHSLVDLKDKLTPDTWEYLTAALRGPEEALIVPIVWTVLRSLGEVLAPDPNEARSAAWIEDWHFRPGIAGAFVAFGYDEHQSQLACALVTYLLRHETHRDDVAGFQAWLDDAYALTYLHLNEYDGAQWINKEQLESLAYWTFLADTTAILENRSLRGKRRIDAIQNRCAWSRNVLDSTGDALYQVEETLGILAESASNMEWTIPTRE